MSETNAEHFKDILDGYKRRFKETIEDAGRGGDCLARTEDVFALINGVPVSCRDTKCKYCDFHHEGGACDKSKIRVWLGSKYHDPNKEARVTNADFSSVLDGMIQKVSTDISEEFNKFVIKELWKVNVDPDILVRQQKEINKLKSKCEELALWLEQKEKELIEIRSVPANETNWDHYKEKLKDILCKRAMTVGNGTVTQCSYVNCQYCEEYRNGNTCKSGNALKKWFDEEYKESKE